MQFAPGSQRVDSLADEAFSSAAVPASKVGRSRCRLHNGSSTRPPFLDDAAPPPRPLPATLPAHAPMMQHHQRDPVFAGLIGRRSTIWRLFCGYGVGEDMDSLLEAHGG